MYTRPSTDLALDRARQVGSIALGDRMERIKSNRTSLHLDFDPHLHSFILSPTCFVPQGLQGCR